MHHKYYISIKTESRTSKAAVYIENTYLGCRITKTSNEVGRIDNFLAKARKRSILPTELDIFDIRQHYVRILFIFQTSHLLCIIISNTVKHKFSSVWN